MLFSIYIYIYIYIYFNFITQHLFFFASMFFWVWLLYSQSRPHEHGHRFQRLKRVEFDFFRSFFKKPFQFYSSKFNCLGIDLHVFFTLLSLKYPNPVSMVVRKVLSFIFYIKFSTYSFDWHLFCFFLILFWLICFL
jgi:hypothetical protein